MNTETPHFKSAAASALKISRAAGHSYLGTEHLLLALLYQHDRDSGAVQLLSRAGYDPTKMTRRLEAAFRESLKLETASAPTPEFARLNAFTAELRKLIAKVEQAAQVDLNNPVNPV